MNPLRFAKMHGAGNDFVLLDGIDHAVQLHTEQIRLLADRQRGIGFDQLLILRRSPDPRAAYAYDIYNTDGSTAQQCGNGARCVVAWLVAERGLRLPAQLLSPAGLVGALQLANGQFGIELSVRQQDVAPPLRHEFAGEAWSFDPVDMGNPHLVTVVPQLSAAPVLDLGRALNRDPRMPEGANVEFVEIGADGELRVRVYERGVGETQACGSGACAVAVVAIRRGWVNDRQHVRLAMPGGLLTVSWAEDAAPLCLFGPVQRVCDGQLHPDFLRST